MKSEMVIAADYKRVFQATTKQVELVRTELGKFAANMQRNLDADLDYIFNKYNVCNATSTVANSATQQSESNTNPSQQTLSKKEKKKKKKLISAATDGTSNAQPAIKQLQLIHNPQVLFVSNTFFGNRFQIRATTNGYCLFASRSKKHYLFGNLLKAKGYIYVKEVNNNQFNPIMHYINSTKSNIIGYVKRAGDGIILKADFNASEFYIS